MDPLSLARLADRSIELAALRVMSVSPNACLFSSLVAFLLLRCLRTSLGISPSHVPLPAARQLRLCYCLHLCKTACSDTPLGQHKLIAFSPYAVPPLEGSKQKMTLWTEGKSEKPCGVIAEGLSLNELVHKHICSGVFLCSMGSLKKEQAENFRFLKDENIPATYKD